MKPLFNFNKLILTFFVIAFAINSIYAEDRIANIVTTSTYPYYLTYQNSNNKIDLDKGNFNLALSYPCNHVDFNISTTSFLGINGSANVVINETYNGTWNDQKKIFDKIGIKGKNQRFNTNVSTTAQKIAFVRTGGNSSGKYVHDVKLTINPHIIIADNSKSLNFGDVEISGGNKQLNIEFKSFLLTGDLTVESSNPDVFRVTTDVIATANTLKKIEENKYSIAVGFYPSKSIKYSETIIIKENGVERYTIQVIGQGTKKTPSLKWVDDSQLIYIGATLVDQATTDADNTSISYTTNADSIITVEGSSLIAQKVGKATITATIAETDLYNEVEISKEFTVTNKSIQTIIWDQDFSNLDNQTPSLSLNAKSDSNLPITYKSDDTNVVNIENGIMSVINTGETYIHAIQEGNEQYAPQTLTKFVKVYAIGECVNYALYDTKKYTIESVTDKSFEFRLSVPGEKISFTLGLPGSCFGTLIISEKETGKVFYNRSVSELCDKFTYKTVNVTINEYVEANRTLVFHMTTGTLEKSFTNVIIPQAKYLKTKDPIIEFKDIEGGSKSQLPIEISYSNLNKGISISLENSSDGKFEVEKQTINTGCGLVGKENVNILLNANEIGTFENTLIIKSGDKEIRVPVRANIKKLYQSISWEENISELNLSQNSRPIDLIATASSGLPVYFTSSDENVAIIDNNKTLKIVGAGTTTIEAKQDGNKMYEPANTISQILTIDKLDPIITWDQDLNSIKIGDEIELNASSSSTQQLVYSSSNTEVATIKGDTLVIIGGGKSIISLNQEGNKNYNAATEITKTISVEKIGQTISWTQDLSTLKIGDKVELNASASSGLKITYSSNNESVASIKNDSIYILGAGSVSITATQIGNNTYNETKIERQLTYGLNDQEIEWTNNLNNLSVGDIITLTATTSAGNLPITFTSDNQNVASISQNDNLGYVLSIVGAGSANITAHQSGNEQFNSASLIKHINIDFIDQTVTWDDDFSTLDFIKNNKIALTAMSSSGLPVEYKSNNPNIAKIENNVLTIFGAGEATITASQKGDNKYSPATEIVKSIKIDKADQEIIWDETNDTIYMGIEHFDLTAFATSGLDIKYTLSDNLSGFITGNKLFVIAEGELTVTASQEGNDNYNAAKDIIKTFYIVRQNQNIIWDQNLDIISIYQNNIELNAYTTSGLKIKYESSNEDIAMIFDNKLSPNGTGYVTISAYQEGNNIFKPAKVMKKRVLVTSEGIGTSLEITDDEMNFDPSNVKDHILRVFNTMGQLIYSEDLTGYSTYRLPSLPKGIYIIYFNGTSAKIAK